MEQLDLFGKTEEEKENCFADKVELSEDERLEITREIYKIFKEYIEEIRDNKSGKIIYSIKKNNQKKELTETTSSASPLIYQWG
jgi:uncharacterized protein (UPF0335 family)